MSTQPKSQAMFVAALVALGAWTAAVFTPSLAMADLAITRWLQQYASPTLDALLSLITLLGNAEITVVFVILMGVVLVRRGQVSLAIVLWAVFIGGSAVEWAAKHSLPHASVPESLQRHGLNIFHHQFHTPYSYPSGHAFRTLLLATAVSWIWTRAREGAAWLRYLLGALVVLMGIALVYLGDHWASEVVGGFLLATLAVVPLCAQRRELSRTPST
jgi:membrane-associated phospholipid phosphatase